MMAQFNNYNVLRSHADVVIETDPPNSSPFTPFDTSLKNKRFICQLERGRYTVMSYPQNQDRRPYPWAIPNDLGDGWMAQRHSNEISRRIEMYRPDGLLDLKTGRENNYDTMLPLNKSARVELF